MNFMNDTASNAALQMNMDLSPETVEMEICAPAFDPSIYFEPFVTFESDPMKQAYLVNAAGDRVAVSREAIVHASRSRDGYIIINLYGADVEDEDFRDGRADPDFDEDEPERRGVIYVSMPWVTRAMLERVAHFAELHFREPMHRIPAPLESATVESLVQCENPASWVLDFARRLRTPHDPALSTVVPEYVSFYERLTCLSEFLFVVRLSNLLAATLASIVKPDPDRPRGPEGHRLELQRLQKVFCFTDEQMSRVEEKTPEQIRDEFPALFDTDPDKYWKE